MSLIEGYRKLVRTITVTDQTFSVRFKANTRLEPSKSLSSEPRNSQKVRDCGQIVIQAKKMAVWPETSQIGWFLGVLELGVWAAGPGVVYWSAS